MFKNCVFLLFLSIFLLNLSNIAAENHHIPSECPVGWSRFESKCYLFHNESSGANFYDALSTCSSVHRSNLLTIHSKEQMEFIRKFIQISKFSVWLGMMRGLNGENDTFTWIDRSGMNYTNWGPNEPTQVGDKKRLCAVVSMKNVTGQWFDVKCQSNYMTVCQQPITTNITEEIYDIEEEIKVIQLRSIRNRQFITLFFVIFLCFLIVYFLFQLFPFEDIKTRVINHRIFLTNNPNNSDTVPFIEKI